MLSPELRAAVLGQVRGARFLATLSMGPVAAGALLVLRSLGMVARIPVWVIPVILIIGLIFTYSADMWWTAAPSRLTLHARIASQAVLVTAMIYATGWGPILAVGLVLVGQESMTTIGVRAHRAVLGWSLSGLLAGEVFLALGWAPSLLPLREMLGLTILMAIVLANSFRSLAFALAEKDGAAALTEQHERRFRALVQSSHDLVFVVDASWGATYASPSCAEVLGYEPRSLLGPDNSLLIHPDDLGGLATALEQVALVPGMSVDLSMRLRHIDGRWLWVEGLATNLLDDPAVLGIVMNARDVTDRRVRHERQVAIAALGRDALGLPSLEAMIELCASVIVRTLEVRACRIAGACESAIEVVADAPAETLVHSCRVPVGEPAQPVAMIEIDADKPVAADEREFVEAIASILLSLIIRGRAEDAMRHQAMHDPLTGLPNRTLFHDRLEQALLRRSRSGGHIAVMVVDLDGFKTVNDSLGHLAGDALLVAVAARFGSSLRDFDTIARLGGDEFAILVDDLETPDQAGRIAQRVLDALSSPLELVDREMSIGASIGITVANRPDTPAEALLANADTAMYRAKREGKGCYRVFEDSMHTASVELMDLEQALRTAIGQDAITPHYQPVVDTHSGRTTSFEALARWYDDERGFIPPDVFIPLAEESGLIVELGRTMLFAACREAGKWQSAFPDIAPGVAVNVSRLQLLHPAFIDEVAAALAQAGLAASSLTLEITESVLAGDSLRVIAVLDTLRRTGVRIAIDDFGTGYSSFAALAELPVDVLKIDKTFIDKLAMSHDGRGFVYAILQLAETLHLETTAEGVEETAQHDELRQLGCTHIQGYLFARPMPAHQALQYLDAQIRLRPDTGSGDTSACPAPRPRLPAS